MDFYDTDEIKKVFSKDDLVTLYGDITYHYIVNQVKSKGGSEYLADIIRCSKPLAELDHDDLARYFKEEIESSMNNGYLDASLSLALNDFFRETSDEDINRLSTSGVINYFEAMLEYIDSDLDLLMDELEPGPSLNNFKRIEAITADKLNMESRQLEEGDLSVVAPSL